MDWCAKDLPLAFEAFKEHCKVMSGGPLISKSEEKNAIMLWCGLEKKEATFVLYGH